MVTHETPKSFAFGCFMCNIRYMTTLLLAVALYMIVFGIDYLFYVKQKEAYLYVSRRTYLLFMGGQISAITLFYPLFSSYAVNFRTELFFLAGFAGLLIYFTHQLTKDRVYVCNLESRSFRCLTPWYVWVKGSEIVFQQLIYITIALSLQSMLGIHLGTYILYIVILLVSHTVLVLNCGKAVAGRLSFGLFAISVPIFYIFTTYDVIWPAIYLHGIMYVFYWLIYADFDIKPLETANKPTNVHKRG